MVLERYRGRIDAVARHLIQSHGSAVHVVFLRGVPDYESVIHFEGGAQHTVDSALFTFGYGGTGADNFSYLLSRLGFVNTNIKEVRCPIKLDRDGTWSDV